MRPQLVVPLALFAWPGPLPVAVRLEPAVDGLLRARSGERKASCHCCWVLIEPKRRCYFATIFDVPMYYCRYD